MSLWYGHISGNTNSYQTCKLTITLFSNVLLRSHVQHIYVNTCEKQQQDELIHFYLSNLRDSKSRLADYFLTYSHSYECIHSYTEYIFQKEN